MMNFPEEHIQDEDSMTDFSLSERCVARACGYCFCAKSETSTTSDDSESCRSCQNFLKNVNKGHSKQPTTQKQIQANLSEQLKKIEIAYQDHQIDQAYQEVRKFRTIAEKVSYEHSLEQARFMAQIEAEMEDVYKYEKILHQDGWNLQKQKKNLKVSSKIEGNTVGVLVEAYLDVKIQNFLQVLLEFDLMKDFMPFMEYSKLEKVVSRNCRVAHCINNFPLITKRQSFFQGIGYNRMNHNKSIFMYTRSLHERKDLQELLGYQVKESKNTIQLDYKYFIIQYKPESPTGGTIKLAINTDLKLKIPMFLLGAASEGFGQDFYNDVRRLSKDFVGSQWERKMIENPSFYNMIKANITQIFGNVQNDQENNQKQNRQMILQ